MSLVEPQDATMYWLSRRTRNDLFLLYCFAESELSTDRLRAAIADRSAGIPDLCVRLRPAPRDLAYPAWVPCTFDAGQFVEHRLPQADWAHLEQALGEVLATGVDAAERPWRLHVFRGITAAPLPSREQGAGDGSGAAGDSNPGAAVTAGGLPATAVPRRVTVAVLQMSHALADGKRAAVLARALFAPDPESASPPAPTRRPERPPQLTRRPATTGFELFRAAVEAVRLGSAVAAVPVRMARTMTGGVSALRAQRALRELTDSGRLPAAGGGFAPSALNGPGEVGGHRVRMIVCPAAKLRAPGFSVTVLVSTAVSIAMQRYLERPGALPGRLGAQVPMALPTQDRAATAVGRFVRRAQVPRNNYRSLSIDLCVDEPDPARRAERIAADLAARRRRAVHPLLSVQDRVTASLPAPILRRDVDRYPIDTVPEALAGHTVISSVYRGPADLTFGGAPVLFTAGFPALGAVMHLTHGVHGLGDTVTISLHADPETLPDLDRYTDLLRSALTEVSAVRPRPEGD